MATTTTPAEGFGGFITSSKGITLSIVSLGVWGVTLIFYRMAAAIFGPQLSYETFCLFTSFLLSLVLGIYISRGFYQKTDKFRYLAIGLNVLLIYTSANGIQAGNANFSTPAKAEKKDAATELALFGLLDVRPWLPDASSKATITSLTGQNEQLTANTKQLTAEVSQLKTTISELNNVLNTRDNNKVLQQLLEENRRLRADSSQLATELNAFRNRPVPANRDEEVKRLQDENTRLNNRLRDMTARLEKCTTTTEALQEENRKLRDDYNKLVTELNALRNRPIPANRDEEVKRLQDENARLNKQLNDIIPRIEQYNAIRNEWITKTQTDSSFNGYAQGQRKMWRRYFNRDYYQDLFYFQLTQRQ